MSESEDESPAIVVDCGTGFCRAGFAGEDAPLSVLPTLIGYPRHEFSRFEGLGSDFLYDNNYVGDRVQRRRDILSHCQPIEHGVVRSWDDLENIWQYLFDNELRASPADHCVLMSEAPLNPRANREKMTEVMFEKFNSLGFYVSLESILSQYACGRGSAIVVQIGDGVTHITPIYEGHLLEPAVRRVNLGGRDITKFLAKHLESRGYVFTTPAELELVRDMKEKHCYVAFDFKKALLSAEQEINNQKGYELPDGSRVVLNEDRFISGECLFQPSLLEMETEGIHDLLFSSFSDCPLDTRRDLCCNIIVSGGSTCFKGFSERLQSEMEQLLPGRARVKVVAVPERKYCAWIGGSILASLSTFQNMYITKKDYEDHGVSVVHKIC